MNKKYVIHPGDYAIGENEKLYADMAAKGWLLEKRGAYLSRFRRDVPQKLRYRLELAPPEMFEREMPDEQRFLYEESGWRYVTRGVQIHVFSAPEDSPAPEIHTDPSLQATTLRGMRRKYYFGWISPVALLLFNLLFPFILNPWGGNATQHIVSLFRLEWISNTAFISLCVLVLIWSTYKTIYGALQIARLHRTLKRGRPIDHAPKKRRHLYWAVNVALLTCCIVFAALSIVQLAQNRKYDMPLEADGPYLLLKDLGWDGARTSNITDLTSNVKMKRSLLADSWYTYECVSAGGGSSWMYQDIYELRAGESPKDVVRLLMAKSVFTRDITKYTRVDVAGLDEAYRGHMEYIAVKGNTVYHITYSDPGVYTDQGTQVDVLRALAELGR